MNYFDVKGKVVMITGASRGIGRSMALGLRDAGAIVYGTGTKPETVAWMEGEAGIVGRVLDSRDMEGTEKFMNEIIKKHRRQGISCLINNAGITDVKLASWFDEEAIEEILSVNYKAVLRGCQAYYQTHRSRGGNIINVSSILGTVGTQMGSVYCSSKGAVNQLTKCLAIEWAPKKFRVNSLCPGLVDTDFIKSITENPIVLEEALKQIPMNRIAHPDEMIGPTIFLVSNASSFMTGQNLIVDGGSTAH